MDNKIEIISQPEKDAPSNGDKSQALKKLKKLVDEFSSSEPEDQSRQGEQFISSQYKQVLDRNKGYSRREEKDMRDSGVDIDSDGFEIPPGKIPIDGHFSTQEIKELIELTKDVGILNDDVEVEVVEQDPQFGDRVIIKEEEEEEEEGEEKSTEEDKLNDKKNE
ncbi:uncharacterized protein RJT21DRAFT_52246 [Scheffersomyces amazonensis]|uniref:uncharacterized protein n=1 Tax=Scheffersomyces amazonensis TaxID=1078765 RepID=UPI00315D4DE7